MGFWHVPRSLTQHLHGYGAAAGVDSVAARLSCTKHTGPHSQQSSSSVDQPGCHSGSADLRWSCFSKSDPRSSCVPIEHKETWESRSPNYSSAFSPRRRCASSWCVPSGASIRQQLCTSALADCRTPVCRWVSTQRVRPLFCTSSSWERL